MIIHKDNPPIGDFGPAPPSAFGGQWYSCTIVLNEASRQRIFVASGRKGGLTNIARHGGQAATAGARTAFMRKFELQVDPDQTLDPEERATRAEYALRAYMADLALKRARRS